MAGIVAMSLEEDCVDEMRRVLRTLQPVRGDEYARFVAVVDGEIIEGNLDDLAMGHPSDFHKAKMAIGSVGFHLNSKPILVKTSTVGPFAVAGDVTIVNRPELREKFPYLVGPDMQVCAGLIGGARNVVEGFRQIFQNIKGRCNLVLLTPDEVFAYRDRWGFRSLAIARGGDGCGVCSESASLGAAFDETLTEIIRDVKQAEVVRVEREGFVPLERFSPWQNTLCPFDIGYSHNGGSICDDISVGRAKFNMGIALAEDYPASADIVSSFPLSGTAIAEGIAFKLNIPFMQVLQYIALGRSFEPFLEQERRERGRIKLVPITWALENFKRIVFGDDSIVEGNQLLRRILTVAKIMTLAHGEGNFELSCYIGCPKKIRTCLFRPEQDEQKLFAGTRDDEVMRRELRLDRLAFNSVPRFLTAIINAQSPKRQAEDPYLPEHFCQCCFTDGKMCDRYFDFGIT